MAVLGAEEGSADDVVGIGRCAGQQQWVPMAGVPWTVGFFVLSQLVRHLRQQAALRINISLKLNGCLCGSLHCLDILVVGSFNFS